MQTSWFHPFAFEFYDVIVFNSWVRLHCVNVPYFLYPFFSWRTSDFFFPGSGYEHSWASVLCYDWASFGYIPKSGIAGSWGRLSLNFLRNNMENNFQYWFSNWLYKFSLAPVLHRSVPFGPYCLLHELSSVFLILAILTDKRWNLRIVLICISLMAKDVKHFFKCISRFFCWEFCLDL